MRILLIKVKCVILTQNNLCSSDINITFVSELHKSSFNPINFIIMSLNPDNAKRYCYRYPHAALTADCAIFGFDGRNLKVLLIERGIEPYKGMWALPGGFMKIDETIEEAALRELK